MVHKFAATLIISCLITQSVSFSSVQFKNSFQMPKHVLHYTAGDADAIEHMVCGERYEMVQLPDSMMDTTLFVGNLCEFVTDDDLSSLFAQASSLNHVPACVARKANNDSLKYGFVTFPSIQEKEVIFKRFFLSFLIFLKDDAF